MRLGLIFILLVVFYFMSCKQNERIDLTISNFDTEDFTLYITLINKTDSSLGYLGSNSVAFNRQFSFEYMYNGKSYKIMGRPKFSTGVPVADYSKLMPNDSIKVKVSLIEEYFPDRYDENILTYLETGGALKCTFDNELYLLEKEGKRHIVESNLIKW